MNSLGRAPTLLVLLAVLGACSTTPLPIREYEPSRDIRVVSYNVHFADAREGVSRVRDHADATASVLRELEPDLACLQEVWTTEYPYVVPDNPFRRMLTAELRSYGWIGPHGASEMAGSSPILYRTSRYLPIRQGIHWFSETPAVPDSAHWGNNLPRHLTWALLFDARAG